MLPSQVKTPPVASLPLSLIPPANPYITPPQKHQVSTDSTIRNDLEAREGQGSNANPFAPLMQEVQPRDPSSDHLHEHPASPQASVVTPEKVTQTPTRAAFSRPNVSAVDLVTPGRLHSQMIAHVRKERGMDVSTEGHPQSSLLHPEDYAVLRSKTVIALVPLADETTNNDSLKVFVKLLARQVFMVDGNPLHQDQQVIHIRSICEDKNASTPAIKHNVIMIVPTKHCSPTNSMHSHLTTFQLSR